jgi:hypothetical protein
MQKISNTSCYYYYGKQWENWDQLRANFSWEIPAQMDGNPIVLKEYWKNRKSLYCVKAGLRTWREPES